MLNLKEVLDVARLNATSSLVGHFLGRAKGLIHAKYRIRAARRASVHTGRTPGCHRDHWDFGRTIVACSPGSKRGRTPCSVLEFTEAARTGSPQLPWRAKV